jgi:DeoR/GlpR family transcriptional regulator of sugar metabolism
MPTFHTYTYTIRLHDPAMHPGPVIRKGILTQDLENYIARAVVGYVCDGKTITIEQVKTVEYEAIPQGGLR